MKLDYDLTSDDEYADIWVYCVVGEREWQMHMYRDKETLAMTVPVYLYSPNKNEPFEEVPRIPRRVQRYFDAALPKVKTLLILKSN